MPFQFARQISTVAAVICISLLFEASSGSRLREIATLSEDDRAACETKQKDLCNEGVYYQNMKKELTDAPILQGFYVEDEEVKEAQDAVDDLVDYLRRTCKNCVEKKTLDELCALKEVVYNGIQEWVTDKAVDTSKEFCDYDDDGSSVCGPKEKDCNEGIYYQEMKKELTDAPILQGFYAQDEDVKEAQDAVDELAFYFGRTCKNCVSEKTRSEFCGLKDVIYDGIYEWVTDTAVDTSKEFCEGLSGNTDTM